MAINLLLYNLTAIAKTKEPLCQWNLRGYFFQFTTKSGKLDPRPKVANWRSQWISGDTDLKQSANSLSR